MGPGEVPEPDPVDYFADHELGSEVEEGDIVREKEGEVDGSESRRHQRTSGNWTKTYIDEEQRFLDGHTRPFYPHMTGQDVTLKDKPWGYFWSFVPVAELDDPSLQVAITTSNPCSSVPPQALVYQENRKPGTALSSSEES